MYKRILITGARGFIGAKCLPIFLEDGYEVHAVSSHDVEDNSYVWHKADLTNEEECRSLIDKVKPTHLLHTAWTAKPRVFWNDPKNIRWLSAGIVLFEAFFKSESGERIVGLGSCAEYTSDADYCSELETLTLPNTIYGCAKLALYNAGMALASIYNKSFAWGRLFYPYGPGEASGRFIPDVINSLLNNDIMQCTHGQQIRDFVYINDVAGSIYAILNSDVNGVVNIASGQGHSLREIASIVANKLSCDIENNIIFGSIAPPKSDPLSIVAKITRLKEEVGYIPKYSIESGLQFLTQTYIDVRKGEKVYESCY